MYKLVNEVGTKTGNLTELLTINYYSYELLFTVMTVVRAQRWSTVEKWRVHSSIE